MAKIEDLQKLDLSQFEGELTDLKEEIEKLLLEYKQAKDKQKFVEITQEAIDLLYKLATAASAQIGSQADAKPDPKREQKGSSKKITTKKKVQPKKSPKETDSENEKEKEKEKESPASQPKRSSKEKIERQPTEKKVTAEEILKELDEVVQPSLTACRERIREYNAQKREAEGPKPEKSFYTKLKERTVSILNLLPDKFKDDPSKLAETEVLALEFHRGLISIWEKSEAKAKSGEKAIRDKLNGFLEQSQFSERKKLARRWKDKLPELEQVMRKEWKESEELEQVAQEMLDNFQEAIGLYEKDPEKAKAFLQKKYTDEQLNIHLPEFVKTALELKVKSKK